ncbi:hypothetical protein J3F84DRAFT_353831 [Trichoderma pleuroticola]
MDNNNNTNTQGPPSLEELFELVCAYGIGGPPLDPFRSPSGLGKLGDWPKGTTSWCWVKAEIAFYQILPQSVRERYQTQESINEALEMLHQRLLKQWSASIGTDIMDWDPDNYEEVERDGPNLVHTVANSPEPTDANSDRDGDGSIPDDAMEDAGCDTDGDESGEQMVDNDSEDE